MTKQKTSKWAIASIVLAAIHVLIYVLYYEVISWLLNDNAAWNAGVGMGILAFLVGVSAVITGIIALVTIRKQKGKGLAILGMCVGGFIPLLGLLALVWILFSTRF